MLAVDICNTLADVDGQLRRRIKGYSNAVYPFPLPEWFFRSSGGMRVFKDAAPLPGSVEFVSALAELYGDVFYVTSRPPEAEGVTRRWLARHGYPDGELVFCPWQEKPAVYASLAPGAVVEDDPRVLARLAAELPGVTVFAPQWPYNRHVRGGRIVPVHWVKRGSLSWGSVI